MQKNSFRPSDYSGRLFEDSILIRRSPIIVGHTSEFQEDKTLKTEINGDSFLTTKKEDVFNSFVNSCLHRFTRLKKDRISGPEIVCPYHKWDYTNEGNVKSVSRKCFAEFKGKAIEKLNTIVDNNIVYVGEVPIVPSLLAGKEFLNYKTRIVKANWKMVIENAIETYHTPFVHRDSLHKVGLKEPRTEYGESHCKLTLSIPGEDKRNKMIDNAFHTDKVGVYEHYFIFPNVMYSHTDGAFFNLTQVFPLSHGETEVRTWFSHAPKKLKHAELFAKNADDFTNLVFEEDDRIVEENYAGCMAVADNPTREVILGDLEDRIEFFHSLLRRGYE